MGDALFSVIIPTYNRADFIARTLQSVINQRYANLEIVIVDDGSTDHTAEVVRSFHDKRIFYFKKQNGERSAARNFGVINSQGQYVTFLDSDDLLRPGHFYTASEFLRLNPESKIFHMGYDVVNPRGEVEVKWKPLPDPANERLVEGNFLSCMGVFCQREILLQNRFNEDRALSGSEDYELWMRLAARYPIRTCPVSTGMIVNHDKRSVLDVNFGRFMKRMELLKYYLAKDTEVVKAFGRKWQKLIAYIDLYAALHLVVGSYRRKGLTTLSRAFVRYPMMIANYRFWAVIKKFLF